MQSTDSLYDQLLARRPPHRPWSLSEVGGGDILFEQLKAWAASLSPYEFDSLAHRAPMKLGAVLLWLHAEVARRFGHEGRLWPILSDRHVVPWAENTWALLYTPDQHLRPSHGELLLGATRMLELRNAFHVEDAQKWFRLICLQFGFTHEDARCRLSAWLSGQMPPVSVQTLLEGHDPGAIEFQKMWRKLRQFRLGNVSRTNMEQHLKACCWVLPSWSGELIEAALKADVPSLADEEDEAETDAFFTAPQLCWDENTEPSFRIELCQLNNINSDGDLEVRCGQNILARLILQPGGGYAPDAEGALSIGTGASLHHRVEVSLATPDGTLVRHGTATLWHADSDVSLLRPSDGQLVTEADLRTGQAFDVIAPADVNLFPLANLSADIGAGYRLHRIDAGWQSVIEARLDDLTLWTSAGFGAAPLPLPTDAIEVRWAARLDFSETYSPAPWRVALSMRQLDPSWTFAGMRWTRADGQIMKFSRWPDYLSLVEPDVARPITIRVILWKSGRVATVPVHLPPPLLGCLRWPANGRPQVQDARRTIRVADAQRALWSFYLPEIKDEDKMPENVDPRACSFMEGDAVRGKLRSRASVLPMVAGYGAPAWISIDPYNSDKQLLDIASRVIDGGVLGPVLIKDQMATVPRYGSFDLSGDHRLLTWFSMADQPGIMTVVDPMVLVETENGWLFPIPPGCWLIAVALFYCGERLGSWFCGTKWSRLMLKEGAANPAHLAALFRIWKAPLMQSEGDENHRANVVGWLRKHWQTVLPIWLASKVAIEGPGGEQWFAPAPCNHWLEVLQSLIDEVQPRPDPLTVAPLVESMSSRCPSNRIEDRLGFTIMGLYEVSPLLAARTLDGYLRNHGAQLGQQGRGVLNLLNGAFPCTDTKADELARHHGGRDGTWLRASIPGLHELNNLARPLPLSYRRLATNLEFRRFALGVWIQEIRSRLHL